MLRYHFLRCKGLWGKVDTEGGYRRQTESRTWLKGSQVLGGLLCCVEKVLSWRLMEHKTMASSREECRLTSFMLQCCSPIYLVYATPTPWFCAECFLLEKLAECICLCHYQHANSMPPSATAISCLSLSCTNLVMHCKSRHPWIATLEMNLWMASCFPLNKCPRSKHAKSRCCGEFGQFPTKAPNHNYALLQVLWRHFVLWKQEHHGLERARWRTKIRKTSEGPNLRNVHANYKFSKNSIIHKRIYCGQPVVN